MLRYVAEALSSRQVATPQLDLKWIILLAGRALMAEGPQKHFSTDQLAQIESGNPSNSFINWEVKVRGQNLTIPITAKMIEEFIALNPLDEAKKIEEGNFRRIETGENPLKVLIVHGKKDGQISWHDSLALFNGMTNSAAFERATTQACPWVQFLPLEGADHSFAGYLDELAAMIEEFISLEK